MSPVFLDISGEQRLTVASKVREMNIACASLCGMVKNFQHLMYGYEIDRGIEDVFCSSVSLAATSTTLLAEVDIDDVKERILFNRCTSS